MPLTKDDIIRLLDSRNISYELAEHRPVFTIEEMLECDLPHPELIAKNLFVRDDKKQHYYLITCLEDKRINLKEFRRKHGTRPLSFASEEDLMKKLGLYRGAVTPLGILNNEEKDVTVFIDRELADSMMGIHPCTNTATLYIRTEDAVKLIRENGNEIYLTDMSETELQSSDT